MIRPDEHYPIQFPSGNSGGIATPGEQPANDLLRTVGLKQHFPLKGAALFSRQRPTIRAVDGVSLSVGRGSSQGIVGESGSGKTTLARMIVRLAEPTAGTLEFEGLDYTFLKGAELRNFRKNIQMVFQDPHSSFDPTRPLRATVTEPLDVLEASTERERRRKAGELFDLVGLNRGLLDRYPNELSGGQLQRAAIARALSTRPKLVVLDEPVSSLDVSTQGQILNLLEDLRRDLAMSYVLIAHNLAVVRHVCDKIAVMYLGRIVEEGPSDQVYDAPRHPYTAALLSSIPGRRIGGRKSSDRLLVKGELPSPLNPPSGCRFRTRCPWVMNICSAVEPPGFAQPDGGVAYCHLHTHGPMLAGRSVNDLLAAGKSSQEFAVDKY